MNSFLSFSPLLVTILVLSLRIKSLYAALSGVLMAFIAIFFAFPLSWSQIDHVAIQWLPVLTEVMAIIAGGLLLSSIMQQDKAQTALAQWIGGRAGKGIGAILLIVHGITPFAESVTGFGIGVTIGIPLLAHLEIPAKKVAVIGLLGLCAVPWGSMGPGTLIAATMSHTPFYDLGIASGIISFIPFTITGMTAAWLGSSRNERTRNIFYGFISGSVFTVIITMANIAFGTALAGAISTVCMITGYICFRKVKEPVKLESVGRKALYSYILLLGGIFLTEVALKFSGLSGYWHYLASPGLWLFIAAFFYVRGLPATIPLQQATRTWLYTAPVTMLFIILGILMASSGMASNIAQTLAEIGPPYAIIAPFVAASGGFITGSNSGANAMFAATQSDIARALGLNNLWFMAVQNVTSAFLLMASPGKIEMALHLTPGLKTIHKFWIQNMMLKIAFIVLVFLAIVGGLETLIPS